MSLMSFFGLVLKNLLRQRTRAVLTLVGITLGITTVVALGVITAGLKDTAGAFVRAGGAEFLVAQEGAADLSFSTLPQEQLAVVAAVPGVADVRGVLVHITRAGSNPFFFLAGVAPEDLAEYPPALVEGRLPRTQSPDEALLGETAAADLDALIGTDVEISDHLFTVVGIYRSDVAWESSGGYAALSTLREIATNSTNHGCEEQDNIP